MRKKHSPGNEFDADYLFVLRTSKIVWLDISTLQEGEMFGNEEGDNQSVRAYQVKCESPKGQLYSLSLPLLA